MKRTKAGGGRLVSFLGFVIILRIWVGCKYCIVFHLLSHLLCSEHLAIDHMGPLPSKHYLLVIVDYYSRYKEVDIVTSTDADQTIRRLKMMFARYGFPLSMQADNGLPFNSNEFEQFCKDSNVHLNNGIPYWLQQNGEVERQNRSLLKRLKISQLEKRNWQDDLQDYLLMYRSTKHSTTMMTPAEMMFSRNIRDKLPSIRAPSGMQHQMKLKNETTWY